MPCVHRVRFAAINRTCRPLFGPAALLVRCRLRGFRPMLRRRYILLRRTIGRMMHHAASVGTVGAHVGEVIDADDHRSGCRYVPNSDVNVIRIIAPNGRYGLFGGGSKKLLTDTRIAFSKELRRMKTEGRDHPAHAAKKGGSARYLAPVAASTNLSAARNVAFAPKCWSKRSNSFSITPAWRASRGIATTSCRRKCSPRYRM